MNPPERAIGPQIRFQIATLLTRIFHQLLRVGGRSFALASSDFTFSAWNIALACLGLPIRHRHLRGSCRCQSIGDQPPASPAHSAQLIGLLIPRGGASKALGEGFKKRALFKCNGPLYIRCLLCSQCEHRDALALVFPPERGFT